MLRSLQSSYGYCSRPISAVKDWLVPSVYFSNKLPPITSCRSGGIHTSSPHRATLQADPQVCMHDVHTRLLVRDLPPLAPVTLRAEVYNDTGKKFCSIGQYVSSSSGEVSLDSAASVGGSYKGVFPAGLLTTLAPPPGQFPYSRLYRKDPAVPWKVQVTVHLGHLELTADEPSDRVASVTLTRLLMAPGVTRHPVKEGRVRGVMYLPPPHCAPAVGVVDMFGAVGGIMEFRAAMLASRGFAVLALPFFGYEDLPAVPRTLELEYFEEAANYVMAQDNVIPDRCGMISVSKSTDIALLLSTKMPALTAVVCIGAVSVSYDTDITHKGKLVAKGIKISEGNMMMDDQGRVLPNPKFIKNYSTETLAAHTLHLEESSPECHYLVVSGSEDAWLCYMCVKELLNYMELHNLSDRIEGVIYKGAGHLIEPPYGPLIHHSYQRILPIVRESGATLLQGVTDDQPSKEDLPGGIGDDDNYVTGIPILFGGKAQETCDAQVDLWRKMQSFLNLRVRDNSQWYQDYLSSSIKGV